MPLQYDPTTNKLLYHSSTDIRPGATPNKLMSDCCCGNEPPCTACTPPLKNTYNVTVSGTCWASYSDGHIDENYAISKQFTFTKVSPSGYTRVDCVWQDLSGYPRSLNHAYNNLSHFVKGGWNPDLKGWHLIISMGSPSGQYDPSWSVFFEFGGSAYRSNNSTQPHKEWQNFPPCRVGAVLHPTAGTWQWQQQYVSWGNPTVVTGQGTVVIS